MEYMQPLFGIVNTAPLVYSLQNLILTGTRTTLLLGARSVTVLSQSCHSSVTVLNVLPDLGCCLKACQSHVCLMLGHKINQLEAGIFLCITAFPVSMYVAVCNCAS